MWRPISSASGRLAVPLKSLKRLSSLRLRVRLRSAAGLASLALAASCGQNGSFGRAVLARRPATRSVAFRLLFPVTGQCSRFHLRNLQAGWLWLLFRVLKLSLKNLAGRLGFEPRQVPPKGIVLPLDDRPTCNRQPSRVSLAKRLPVNCLLQKHFAPVSRARQGAGKVTPTPAGLQSFLRCFRISPGLVQPEERRTGPRQRGMEGCLRCARSRKNALDFCKGRMLGKDDAFKVVLDPASDPGADKRGLLRSGQVSPHLRGHRRSLLPA